MITHCGLVAIAPHILDVAHSNYIRDTNYHDRFGSATIHLPFQTRGEYFKFDSFISTTFPIHPSFNVKQPEKLMNRLLNKP